MGKRIQTTHKEDERLLGEVNSLCPVCGRALVIEKNGRQMSLYDRAHVYPHSPTQKQIEALADVVPPAAVESIDNLILLCKDCHKKYDTFTTCDEYLKMYDLKCRLKGRYEAKRELATIEIEADLLKVLKELESIEVDGVCELRMDPLPIKKKLIPGLFRQKIIQLATQYYSYLRGQFQAMDARRAGKFNVLATQIKLAGLKAQADLRLSREEMVNGLVDWLLSKTNSSRAACEVVIAYFIQDCEVFDALPE